MANPRIRTAKPASRQDSDTALTVFLVILTVLMPPVGLVALFLRALAKGSSKKAKVDSAADWKRTTQTAAQKVTRYMTSADNREEDVATWPSKHGHTPLAYSYDACALDKRLQQLKDLYEAGLYTKEQYLEAKAKAKASARR